MASSKRVVLHHQGGRFAGLWQIVGTTDELPQTVALNLPRTLPRLVFLDHEAAGILIAEKPRYVLYKETPIVTP
jgi:hypothetical protein